MRASYPLHMMILCLHRDKQINISLRVSEQCAGHTRGVLCLHDVRPSSLLISLSTPADMNLVAHAIAFARSPTNFLITVRKEHLSLPLQV